MRIAISFSKINPSTTGAYYEKAFEEEGHDVAWFDPQEFDNLTGKEAYELYVVVDDGMEFYSGTQTRREFPDIHPLVYIAIDTHVDESWFEWRLRLARDRADLIACAQKNGASRMDVITGRAFWLPLGCDPETHHVGAREKEYNVCFVGHFGPKPWHELRMNLVDTLMREEFDPWFVGSAYLKDATEVYARSRVVLNASADSDVNMRMFEAACSGSAILTDYFGDNGLQELFRPETIATYRTVEEAPEILRDLLANDDARVAQARAARTHVLENHTYRHRVRQLVIEASMRGLLSAKTPIEV